MQGIGTLPIPLLNLTELAVTTEFTGISGNICNIKHGQAGPARWDGIGLAWCVWDPLGYI